MCTEPKKTWETWVLTSVCVSEVSISRSGGSGESSEELCAACEIAKGIIAARVDDVGLCSDLDGSVEFVFEDIEPGVLAGERE